MTQAQWDEAMQLLGPALAPGMLWRNRNSGARAAIADLHAVRGGGLPPMFMVKTTGHSPRALGVPLAQFLRHWEPLVLGD